MTPLHPIAMIASLGLLTACGAAVAGGYEMAQGAFGGSRNAAFFNQWDADGDGRVTLEDMQTQRGMMFDMFDMNADGGLDASERAEMAQAAALRQQEHQGTRRGIRFGGGNNNPQQRFQAMMQGDGADTDGNGVLSRTEWDAATVQLFAQMDGNGDGSLDRQDFRRG